MVYVRRTLVLDYTIAAMMPIYQCTISPDHVQSVHNLSCPCPVSTQCCQPLSSQYTAFSAHFQSVLHFSSPCPVKARTYVSMFSQYTTSFGSVQQVEWRTDYMLAGEMVYWLDMGRRDCVLTWRGQQRWYTNWTTAGQLVYWLNMGRKDSVPNGQGSRDTGHKEEGWGTEYRQVWW